MGVTDTRKKTYGFTLIELLVVISIIAAAAIDSHAGVEYCQRQSQKDFVYGQSEKYRFGLEAYAVENNGKIVNGYSWQPYMQSEGGPGCWVEPPQDENGDYLGDVRDEVPLEYRLNGLRKGLLYSYLEETDVFHCPGDPRFKKGTIWGSSLAFRIYRSYSIPDGIHANAVVEKAMKPYKVPRIVTRTAIKINEIRRPSNKYILIEEAYDGGTSSPTINFNDASWDLGIFEVSFWDPLGIYHNDSCTLAFADAHVESYKFRDRRTVEYFEDRSAHPKPGGDNQDLQYFLRAWPGIPDK